MKFKFAFGRGARIFMAALMITGLSSLAYAQAADKDVLVLKSGDKLHGSLVKGEGDSIIFHTDDAGDLKVPVANIQHLHSHASFAVLPKAGQVKPSTVKTAPVTIGDGKITSENGTVVAAGDVGYLISEADYQNAVKHAGFFHGWTGTANGGITIVQATQHGQSYNAGISLARVRPSVPFFRTRNRTLFNVTETYGKLTSPVIPPTPGVPDDVVKTSIFHADAERDEYLSKSLYALGAVAFDHNYSQGLELQQIYGGGLGWTPIASPVQQLDLKGDVHYEMQKFANSTTNPNQNLIGTTFGENYRRTLPAKIQFTQYLNIIPAWNNMDAYAANGGVGLVLPVYHNFGVNFAATDSFINNPSFGYKKNSFQYITGVTYTFK